MTENNPSNESLDEHAQAKGSLDPGSAQDELDATYEILEVITKEHRRISRDLHDSVGQELTALRYLTANLALQLGDLGSDQAEQAELIAELVQEAQRKLRRAIKGVLPVELDAEGLPAGLHRLAAEVGKRYGVECSCEAAENIVLPNDECATELLRIAQEASRNAVKHTRATKIALRLTVNATEVALEIENNGEPIDPEDQDSISGFGIQIMRSRASLIGAEFEVASESPRQTIVRCTLPSVRISGGVDPHLEDYGDKGPNI